ncbi:hypothetical protein OAR97_08160 [Arcobacteraceae bacterium]|nr:hypothetical protein [Arcobacteraceae bacterium]
MIIDIDEELFTKIKDIVKSRNITVYNQLVNIKESNSTQSELLLKARAIKTNRKKDEINIAIKELIHSKTKPTKYQVNKKTSISYKTLDKYFDCIFDEVLKEIKS